RPSQVHSESRRAKGNPSTDVAPLPPTPYTPPPSPSLRLLLGSVRLLHLPHPGASGLALDRGYESEEELRLVESPSDLLAHMIAQLGGRGLQEPAVLLVTVLVMVGELGRVRRGVVGEWQGAGVWAPGHVQELGVPAAG
ncbi:hypothetical protein CLOP_g436, partial [Closterium sp. NIES-67]